MMPRQSQLISLRASLDHAHPTAAHGVLPFGDARVDGCLLGGGLALGHLHEIATDGLDVETGAAGAGFAACLLAALLARDAHRHVFWVSQAGDLHAPGLLPYGVDPARVVEVGTGSDAESLSAMETVLRDATAAAVVGEIGRLDRTPSRRLQLACQAGGTTGFVLRRWRHGAGKAGRESTASVTRWHVVPLLAWNEEAYGARSWRVTLVHARGGRAGSWVMQVPGPPSIFSIGKTGDAHRLRVVAELAGAEAASVGLRRTG